MNKKIEIKKKNNHKQEVKSNSDRKKTTIIVIVLLLVALTIGIAYAYFSSRTVSDEKRITTANLDIDYVDGDEFRNVKLDPLYESEVLDQATKKTFKINKKENSENVTVKIDLTDLNISENFLSEDLKWALYEEGNEEAVGTGNFGSLNKEQEEKTINLLSDLKLTTTDIKTYDLYIWIQETGLDQSSMQDGSLTGKITVTAELTEES